MSSSYACVNCCPASCMQTWVDPPGVTGFVGDTQQFTGFQQNEDCFGNPLSPFSRSATWSSTNSSVATINSTGFGTAQNVGNTSIQGTWTAFLWDLNANNTCTKTIIQPLADAVCDVLAQDVNYRKVSFSNVSANFSTFNYSATLNIRNASGGASACSGSASNPFTISIDFDMPLEANAIIHPDKRTFVTDNDNQQFRLVKFDFVNLDFSSKKGTMRITLFRIPTKPSDRVDFNIVGTSAGQTGIWSGGGRVHLQCH